MLFFPGVLCLFHILVGVFLRGSHLIFHHTIPNSNLCKYVLRFRRILFQLPPDVGHVDPQDAVVIVGVGAPDAGDDGVVGHDPSGVLRQQGDDLELNLC